MKTGHDEALKDINVKTNCKYKMKQAFMYRGMFTYNALNCLAFKVPSGNSYNKMINCLSFRICVLRGITIGRILLPATTPRVKSFPVVEW